MDLSVFSTAVQTALGSHLPGILGAIALSFGLGGREAAGK